LDNPGKKNKNMKNKSTTRQHHKPKSTHAAKKKSPVWMVVGVIAVASIGGVLWRAYVADKSTTNSTYTTTPANIPANANKDLLVGRWTRTDSDGAYAIEIKSASADGKLEASYFNPGPIKVGHAEWQKKNTGLTVIVELRDVNYPGSTYTLNFIPSENRMMGNYYQAVEGTNFDVEFVRSK
jgi:hypothetical protein